ncbi:MAG: hypothetical protein ACOY93_20235 [Bacillota bacterium]
MSIACDPKGLCPRCGYQNGAGRQRCIRCTQVLYVPQGCSGACTQCLIKSVTAPEEKER